LRNIRSIWESFVDILILVKVCLTNFWFWVPVLFAASLYIQLWAVFAIHPLTILILPTILGIFAMIQEEKRVKAQYGLDEILVLKASHGLGEGPLLERKTWDVEKAIKEYQKTLKRDKKED
jgi:hypothetical protein